MSIFFHPSKQIQSRDMAREGKKMHRENLEVSIHSPTVCSSLGETSAKTLEDVNDLEAKNAIGGRTHRGEDKGEERRENLNMADSGGSPREPLWGCHVIRSLMGAVHPKSATLSPDSSDFWAVSLPSSSRD